MKKATIYTTHGCPYCVKAIKLLTHKQVEFEEINLSSNEPLLQKIVAKTGMNTVPQIWIGDDFIGGCDDLYSLENDGTLDQMLR